MAERKLVQYRPVATDATAIKTVTDTTNRFRVDLIQVANGSNASAHFTLYDADSGLTLGRNSEIAANVHVPAGLTYPVPGPFYFSVNGQQLGVKSSVSGALTFTVYGVD